MSRVFALSILLAAIACVHGYYNKIVLPGERFPTCSDALDFFGNEGINLYSNSAGVRRINVNECITEEGRFKFIYYCSDGIDLLVKDPKPQLGDRFPFNLEPLELELDVIHDLAAELAANEPELVLCFNRPLSKPTPPVPAPTQRCSAVTGPTLRSQYAPDEDNICFGSCYYPITKQGKIVGKKIKTVTQCCPGYRPLLPAVYSSSEISGVTCVHED